MRCCATTVSLLTLILTGGLMAQPIEDSLNRMKTLVSSLRESGNDATLRQYGEIILHVETLMRSSRGAKARVAKEIGDLAKKRYTETPAMTQGGRIDRVLRGDFTYAMQLVDILVTVDRQVFLDLCESLLADPQVSSLYRSALFDKLLSTRVVLGVIDPNALVAYDKGVLSIGLRLLDKKDGFRFTFGDRNDFQLFVRHLIGHSFDDMTVPPLGREKGLEIARRFMADNRFLFVEKEWYMGQLARLDPQVREEYVRKLKEHVDNPKEPKWLRVEYAEKLVRMGEFAPEKLDELKKMPQEPNTVTYEYGTGQNSQTKKP